MLSILLLAVSAAAAPGFDVVGEVGGALHRLESAGGENVPLYYRRSDDGGQSWTKPVRVDGGRPAYRFGAGDARLAIDGRNYYAIWTRPGKGPYGSGPLAVAMSNDAGRTWVPRSSPYGSDSGAGGRRFPALAAFRGRLYAIWLDRFSNSKVRVSVSSDEGETWTDSSVLDADACECCWNAALGVRDGSVWALWRGKGPRDMAASVTRDGGRIWSKPARIGEFGWKFDGCPHEGGALAVTDDGAAALVWTGKPGEEGLYLYRTSDGKAWRREAKLGGAGAKHGDLTSSEGRLGVVWEEDGKVLGAANGAWAKPKVLAVKGSHPRIVPKGAVFRVFWAEKSRVAEADF